MDFSSNKKRTNFVGSYSFNRFDIAIEFQFLSFLYKLEINYLAISSNI
jgi:hypothetical protein